MQPLGEERREHCRQRLEYLYTARKLKIDDVNGRDKDNKEYCTQLDKH